MLFCFQNIKGTSNWFDFVVYMIYYPVVCLMFAFNFFSDQIPRVTEYPKSKVGHLLLYIKYRRQMKLVWFCGLEERINPFWGAVINKERYLVKYLVNIGSVNTILDSSGSKNNVLKMAVISINTLLKTFSIVLNRSITDMAGYGFHFFKNQVP